MNLIQRTLLCVCIASSRMCPSLPTSQPWWLVHLRASECVPHYMYMSCNVLCMCRRIGPRSHVWCEKELVEKAAWEFGEVHVVLVQTRQHEPCTVYCILIAC